MKWVCLFFFAISPLLSANVVLVTGGSQGIGKAIAEKFAKEGKKVIVADIKKGEFSESIDFIQCDISSESAVSSLFEELESRSIKLEGVVHNAAVAVYKDMENYSLKEWERIFRVNLGGVFLVSRKALPLMKSSKSGWMILIGSVHARITSTMNSPYVATKGGVIALTRALALECAPFGIRVNAISPGAIITPMLMENWGDIQPENHPLVPRIPLQRLGNAEEIASVAVFLASEGASYITGAEIVVDGGLSIHFD
jgi:meso-butanediol dehydrogenase/(S,S)-butanediol dehydrogenase/diacetyl reductase